MRRYVTLLLCCVLLAGCADSDGERRFANDTSATEEALATATDAAVDLSAVTPTVDSASPVAIADMFGSESATATIYLRSRDQLFAISSPWTEPRRIWDGESGRLIAFRASPTGDRVALLIAPAADGDRLHLEVIDEQGVSQASWDDLGPFDATDDNPGDDADYANQLAWTADGQRIALALPLGGLIAIPLSGEPVTLIGADRLPPLGELAWSPSGDAIAFVAPVARKDAGALYVATTTALPLDPIPVVPASLNGRRTIAEVAWHPDGETLLYTIASTTNDPTFGGDLFAVSVNGGPSTLVAGASRVGPVSRITNFVLSPSGQGVAYVVTVPRDDGGFKDSLWLQVIGGNSVEALPVPAKERVTGLWWTAEGVLWQSVAPTSNDDEEVTISLVEARLDPIVVYRGTLTPAPNATQVASDGSQSSPVAVASPAASPSAATPEVES